MLDRETIIEILEDARAELLEIEKEVSKHKQSIIELSKDIKLLDNQADIQIAIDNFKLKLDKLEEARADAEQKEIDAQCLYNQYCLQYDIDNKYPAWHDRLQLEIKHTETLVKQFASYLYKDTIDRIEVVSSTYIPVKTTVRTVARSEKAKEINCIGEQVESLRNATNEFLNIHGVDIIIYFKDNSFLFVDLKCVENKTPSWTMFESSSIKQYQFITVELFKYYNNQKIKGWATDPHALNKIVWYYLVNNSVIVINKDKLKEYIENTNQVLINRYDRGSYIKSKDYNNIYTYYDKDRHLQADINVEILIEKDIAKYYNYKDFKDTEYSHKVIEK